MFSIENMGSIYVFFIIYFVCLLILGCLWSIKTHDWFVRVISPKRIASMYTHLYNMLIYQFLIFIIIEAYIEYLVSTYIQFKHGGQQIFMSVFAVITLVVVPMVYYIMIFKMNAEMLQKPAFKSRYEKFFYYVNTLDRGSLGFYPVYVARRILFVILAFEMEQYLGIGLLLLFFLNLSVLIYVSHQKPIIGQLKNRLEIFNEYMVCTVTIQMALFSDWVSNVDNGPLLLTRWKYGHLVNGFIGYFIYANLSIFLFFQTKNFYHVGLKFYNQIDWSSKIYNLILIMNKLYFKLSKSWTTFLQILMC